MLYLISGFCFIKTYSFVYVFNNNSKDIQDKLILYFVFGSLICKICFAFPLSFGKYIDDICITLISVISGFIIAKIMNSRYVNIFLDKLKVRRTVNTYLWNDLIDRDKVMKAKITINNIVYEGKIHLIEELSNNPHIVLAEYSICGKKEIEDNKIIVLDSSKASEIIIEYDKNSQMLDEIRFS